MGATMADEAPDKKAKSGALDIADIMADWPQDEERNRENADWAYSDLEFYAADPDRLSQWTQDALTARKGRPTVQVNRLPQYVNQVVNDMRLSKPAIQCVPVGGGADINTAETMNGVIRYIENRSDAQAAYFNAADSQVVAGIGHWKVITEYAADTTFEQEIRITGIEDGISVVWDADSVLPTREDAKRCWEPVDMTHRAFKARFEKASDGGWDTANVPSGWYGDDFVRVCRYWCKKPVKKTLALLPDGSVVDLTDKPPEEVAAVTQIVEEAAAAGANARVEKRDGFEVVHYLITAKEILEGPTKWAGRYIPIVPVLGREVKIGRRIVRKGLVRDAADSQRMYNYSRSADIEVTALQPKAPFIGTEKQFKAYEAVWAKANSSNRAYLPYMPDGAAPPPQRSAPPVSSSGLAAQVQAAALDMEATLGIYRANLGAPSNETSGRAITARQREGDVGSYQFMNNFERAIAHTGRILVDLIPHIYDSERVIRIMGEDGKIDTIEINKEMEVDGVMKQVKNDLTVGTYDVVLKVGPAFSTRREEMREGMQTLMSNPQIAALLGDLFAEAQDWPLSKEMGERLEFLLPPEIRAKRMAERGEKPPMQEPPPPDPKMVLDVRKSELEVEGKELDNQKKELELASTVAQALAIDPAQLDQRFQNLEFVMQSIAQFIDDMQQRDVPPGMPPDDMPPPDSGVMPPPDEQPPQPGGFFNAVLPAE